MKLQAFQRLRLQEKDVVEYILPLSDVSVRKTRIGYYSHVLIRPSDVSSSRRVRPSLPAVVLASARDTLGGLTDSVTIPLAEILLMRRVGRSYWEE